MWITPSAKAIALWCRSKAHGSRWWTETRRLSLTYQTRKQKISRRRRSRCFIKRARLRAWRFWFCPRQLSQRMGAITRTLGIGSTVSWLLQLRVLGFRLLQNRDVGIGVFPKREAEHLHKYQKRFDWI